MQKNDLTGKKFGRWTAISFDGIKNKHTFWECKCDCGNTKSVDASVLRRGDSLSCGCLRSEIISNRTKKWVEGRLEQIYRNMKNRCYNHNVKAYKNYGGRGIKVCEDWLKDGMNFQEWALANGYAENLTIERKDVNKDYEPSNCVWVSMKEQQNNRRDNKKVKYKGKIVTISQLSEITGILDKTLYYWKEKGCLKEKLSNGKIEAKKYLFNGELKTLRELSEQHGLDEKLVRNRMRRGWNLKDSLQPPKTSWKRKLGC
ncbi:MAG: hypothetical protein N3I35_06620 [Clostridia bacterium]|nr:hypothetical protein [Clostridia bacterium]